MKAKLIRYEITNSLKELGWDMSNFHVFFQATNKTVAKTPFIIGYDRFHNFFKENKPEIYNYLTKIRSSISGYGTKHSKVIKILLDENFDFETHLQSYLNEIDDDIIKAHYEHENRIIKPEDQAAVKKMFESFVQLIDEDFATSNIKMEQFTDALDQTIHELVFKYYPEIFDKTEEHISAYRKELYYTTTGFVEKIDKIMNDAI